MRRQLATLVMAIALPLGGTATANAQQEWLLNANASHFYMQTAKNNTTIETQRFTGLDGSVSRNGDATLKIDLISVKSNIDVRDVRMRYLLFETFRFPQAEITAKLDMQKLQDLTSQIRITYPLKFKLSLHGVEREFEAPVTVTRITDQSVSVTSAEPIIVTADDFNLTAGIAKLSEAVGGIPIVAATSISFDLVFETGEKIPAIEAARAETQKRVRAEETATISTEACETRFSVISTTQAIYFKIGSAELDHNSEPLLNSVADIANRCPSARVEVTGHTDSVGGREANRSLSTNRASAVVGYLVQHGVPASRIESTGYGDTRPIAANDSEEHRAKNRRIEFRVLPK
ncbi:OmpA family protein [Bradyrhizobium sp. INPA03-11B]|uniref:OmpA family protein n=1 Tax=Bradyrhizobium sp. INPA03-11B TaxID=418598 RepID=UPI00338EC506